MTIIDALILGFLQGLLEWLPVSSKSMVILYLVDAAAYSGQTAYLISLFLHLSTATAALVMFRSDYWLMLRHLVKRRIKNDKEGMVLLKGLLASSIITAIFGLPLYYFVKEYLLDSSGLILTGFIGILLMITSIILKLSSGKQGFRTLENLKFTDMFVTGLAQALAALPGLSRSGLVASSLLFKNFDRRDALRFTFIISVPAIYGIAIADLVLRLGFLQLSLTEVGLINLLIASVVSFITSILSLRLMLEWATRLNFSNFLLSFGGFSFFITLIFFLLR